MTMHDLLTKPLHYIFNKKQYYFCSKCEKEVEQNDKFCKHCGKKIS